MFDAESGPQHPNKKQQRPLTEAMAAGGGQPGGTGESSISPPEFPAGAAPGHPLGAGSDAGLRDCPVQLLSQRVGDEPEINRRTKVLAA